MVMYPVGKPTQPVSAKFRTVGNSSCFWRVGASQRRILSQQLRSVVSERRIENKFPYPVKKQRDAADIRPRSRGVSVASTCEFAALAWSVHIGECQRPGDTARGAGFRGALKIMNTTLSEMERQTFSMYERFRAFEPMANQRNYRGRGAS